MYNMIVILILLCIMLVMAVYATATMLQLIFKGTLTLAPWYVKAVAWFFVVSGSIVSVLFSLGIIALLPIV